MAQPFSLRYPLIEGYGNFGSLDGDPPAAMRYTECRLTPIAQEMLSELKDRTVVLRPNYASTTEEPEVLPAQFPNLLVNGASGIAVGMATNIPPHNLKEVCAALDILLKSPGRDAPLEKPWSRPCRAPDFPTGGVILNTSAEELRQVYATGQGTIKLRGTYEPDPERPNQINVTSIPYGIEKDALVERIGALIGEGKVPQLTNVKDLSTDDVRIALELEPRPERRRGDGVPVQEHAVADEFQRQPDLPPALRRRGGRGPRSAGFEGVFAPLPRLPAGDRDQAAVGTNWKGFCGESTSWKGSRSSSTTWTRRSAIIRASNGKPDASPKLMDAVRAVV